jgi:hypothetical protein
LEERDDDEEEGAHERLEPAVPIEGERDDKEGRQGGPANPEKGRGDVSHKRTKSTPTEDRDLL